MKVFGVFLRWKKLTPESTPYIHIYDIGKIDSSSSPAQQAFKRAVEKFSESLTKDPAYVFYSRVDAPNGDCITLTVYTSLRAFTALRAAHDPTFVELETARKGLAEEFGLSIEEREVEFELGQFDENNFESTNSFFDSVS